MPPAPASPDAARAVAARGDGLVIRVAILEDHAAIAEGLGALLATSGMRVVGIAHTATEAHDLIRVEQPAVVLCDVMLGGRDAGLELAERHGARSRFLMLSAYDFPAHHARAVRAGAAGYLSKLEDAATLLEAIRAVAAGRRVFSPAVLASAKRALKPPTDRECELLVCLADGASNDACAEALGISVKTVEGMLRRLFDRYGAGNRTQLVRVATREGWLPVEFAGSADGVARTTAGRVSRPMPRA